MQLLRSLKLLLPVLMLLVTAGCAALVQAPQAVLKGTNIVGLDTAGAEIEFYLGITNPNSFDLSLLGYSYDLRIMTLSLASGGLQERQLFKAGTETEMRLPIRVRFSDFMELLKRRPDPDRIPYQMTAYLQIKTLFGEMTVPVESSGTFSVPKEYRPEYYLDHLKGLLQQLSP